MLLCENGKSDSSGKSNIVSIYNLLRNILIGFTCQWESLKQVWQRMETVKWMASRYAIQFGCQNLPALGLGFCRRDSVFDAFPVSFNWACRLEYSILSESHRATCTFLRRKSVENDKCMREMKTWCNADTFCSPFSHSMAQSNRWKCHGSGRKDDYYAFHRNVELFGESTKKIFFGMINGNETGQWRSWKVLTIDSRVVISAKRMLRGIEVEWNCD